MKFLSTLGSIILYPFSIIALITIFMVTIFPMSIIALPFPDYVRTKITIPAWRLFSFLCIHFVTLSRVKIYDKREEKEKRHFTPRGLFIANHQSYMDIPLVLRIATIPPIMKKQVLYIPIFGLCGYSSGAIIVDRKEKSSRKKVFELSEKRLLRNPIRSLMYYPEGTRRRGQDLPKDVAMIKKPLLQLAFKNNVKVFPLSLHGTDRVIRKNGTIRYFQPISMIVHQGISPKDYQSEQDFIQFAWNQVVDGYKQLSKEAQYNHRQD